jgi:hypothetical protein
MNAIESRNKFRRPAYLTDSSIERLAARMHFLLEKYDPSDDGEWSALSDHQRELFRSVVRGMVYDFGIALFKGDPTTA